MKKRILALLLCAVTLLSMTILTGAAAESGSAPADELAPTAEPAPEVTPEQTEAPAPEAENEPQTEEVPQTETDGTPAGETSLFDRLLACTVLDDIWAIMDAAGEDALDALTDDQWAQIDAKIEALEPEPAPAIVIEESQPPVPSEVDYVMINYTNVAPLGDPVTGQHQ